jgi:hypothetical protein
MRRKVVGEADAFTFTPSCGEVDSAPRVECGEADALMATRW